MTYQDEGELERLLAHWAATRSLTDAQVVSIRATVLSSRQTNLDADWLWSLLRPLTALIDRAEEVVPYVAL